MIVFDIETGPLDEQTVLEFVKPYQGPLPLDPFDEATVKIGNLKDPGKIKAKVEAARNAHIELADRREREIEEGDERWRREAMEKAALSPLTGQVLAIGYLPSEPPGPPLLDMIGDGTGLTEPQLLAGFWGQCKKSIDADEAMVGHNILGFDLPFLVQRSRIANVSVPDDIRRGRYFNDRLFTDTMVEWSCGDLRKFVKLDTLARVLDVGTKPNGVNGGMFAEMLKTDRNAAREYLCNDLRMTAGVAERLGVI